LYQTARKDYPEYLDTNKMKLLLIALSKCNHKIEVLHVCNEYYSFEDLRNLMDDAGLKKVKLYSDNVVPYSAA
jgi:hypothetical protein